MISQTFYRSQVLVSQQWFNIKLQKVASEFIWDSKKPKIRRSLLINKYDKGGLQMQDYATKNKAFKAKWFYYVFKNSQETTFLKELIIKLLGIKGITDLVKCNITKKQIKQICNESFWTECWQAWAEFNYFQPKSKGDIKNQIIHYNSDITKEGRPYTIVSHAKIQRIGDMFDDAKRCFIPQNTTQVLTV